MKKILLLDKTYLDFLHDVKDRITAARLKAARSVNSELILLYWDIGRGIVEKQKEQGWGESVVEMLSKDLKRAFPEMTGFSADNLWRMRQFFLEYNLPEFLEQAVPEKENNCDQILEQVVPETTILRPGMKSSEVTKLRLLCSVPWGHHLEILKKTNTIQARLYYLESTTKFGWSRNVLLNQIKANAYERARIEKKTHNFPTVLPDYLAEQAEEALKSSYNLEFLGIHREIRERELEDRLLDRLRDFILELGYGFCFVGRQYRLEINSQEFFVDLLFYHRFLKSLVAIELKVGPFKPEYAGKMDFYLNLLNEKEKAPDDNPSIGIILCAEKDDMVVEFSLKSKTNPIGVAEYQLTNKLPRELKGRLPDESELRAMVLTEMAMK